MSGKRRKQRTFFGRSGRKQPDTVPLAQRLAGPGARLSGADAPRPPVPSPPGWTGPPRQPSSPPPPAAPQAAAPPPPPPTTAARPAPAEGPPTPPEAPPAAPRPPAPAPRPMPTPPPPTTPRGGRAERRREQRRQQRRRRISLAGVVLVLGGIIATVATVLIVKHAVNGSSSPKPVRTQHTTLFQIQGPSGTAVASALLAHDPATKRGVVLLVPERVIADIPGHGAGPFGNALSVGSPSLAQATLADLVGITVDDGWVLDTQSAAQFISRIGGIQVDVDTQVLRPVKGGGAVVLVPSGPNQHLDGSAAVAYATYGQGGEIKQLTRMQTVLEGIFARLNSATAVEAAIRSLSHGSRLTGSPAAIANVLTGLEADDKAGAVDYRILDVKPIDAPGPTAYTLNRTSVREFVQQSLAASIPKGLLSGGNTVLVKNGVGTPELGSTTRQKLLHAGFVYIDGGNVPGFSFRRQPSAVVIYSTGATARAKGAAVANALGLPASDVVIGQVGQSVADIIVVLGRDYHP